MVDLQAACYLDCRPVKKDIVGWMQRLLNRLVYAYSVSDAEDVNETTAPYTCSSIWDDTEVRNLRISPTCQLYPNCILSNSLFDFVFVLAYNSM